MGGCSKERPQAAERSRARHDSSENYADRVGWVSAGTETRAGWRCPEELRGDSGRLGARDGGARSRCPRWRLPVRTARRRASSCRTALLLKWRPPAFPICNDPLRKPLVLKWLPLPSRSQSRALCSIKSGTLHPLEGSSPRGTKEVMGTLVH